MRAAHPITLLLDQLEPMCSRAPNASDCIQQFKSDQRIGKLSISEVKGFVAGLYAADVIEGETLTMFERSLADLAAIQDKGGEINCGTLVERPEDMSPDGRLSLCMDTEGDILVKVVAPTEASGRTGHSAEFVCHCPRSRHTLKALRDLMRAMMRDNQEHPLQGQVTSSNSTVEV